MLNAFLSVNRTSKYVLLIQNVDVAPRQTRRARQRYAHLVPKLQTLATRYLFPKPRVAAPHWRISLVVS